MTDRYNSTDASFYFRDVTAMDVARMDSSIVYGNLADVMKNATVPYPSPKVIRLIPLTYLKGVQEIYVNSCDIGTLPISELYEHNCDTNIERNITAASTFACAFEV